VAPSSCIELAMDVFMSQLPETAIVTLERIEKSII
jgi:hypothetical protein